MTYKHLSAFKLIFGLSNAIFKDYQQNHSIQRYKKRTFAPDLKKG